MWLEVLNWIDHVWSSIECVCCACGPCERVNSPFICFVSVLYVESYLLISEFENWITSVCTFYGSLCDLHTMSLSNSLQFLYIFPFSVICENYVVSVYVGLSKSRLCVLCELCSVCFLVVGNVCRFGCSL